MKRLLDDLIGDVRTVVVAGVDVVHAGLDRLSQNSNGAFHITGRSKDARAGKLHCTIPHAVHGH